MKFGQVMEYNRNICVQKIMQKMRQSQRLVPDLLFFKKALYKVKASGLQLSFDMS